jgi:amidophosphoribosyltransferase
MQQLTIVRSDKFQEECGIFGVWQHPAASEITYLGLYALQHRGQESTGIVSSDQQHLYSEKGLGYVNEVFSSSLLARLPGQAAIGHVRYCTAGDTTIREAQPFLVNYHRGPVAICHNGNFPTAARWRQRLQQSGAVFTSTSDTEVLLHQIARTPHLPLPQAIVQALTTITGAYSLLFLTPDSLIAVRDPHGFRPLVLGKIADRNDCYTLASETCALDLIGAEYVREILPGELLVINSQGLNSYFPFPVTRSAMCIFEHVYFARPDSQIFGQNVGQARHRMGEQLAQEHPIPADIVVPIPDTGLTAALGYATASGLPLRLALVRNQYVGRTFIKPQQAARNLEVKIKLNPIRELVTGKRIVLIDDSLVRGTTSQAIVQMLRQAGAAAIHLRISCPPTIAPCYYGVDTPERNELLAAQYTVSQMATHLGVDSLAFLSLAGLRAACGETVDNISRYCTACYDNNYPLKITVDLHCPLDNHRRSLPLLPPEHLDHQYLDHSNYLLGEVRETIV